MARDFHASRKRAHGDVAAGRPATPGRATLAERLPSAPSAPAAVQRRATGGGGAVVAHDPFAVHLAAQRGIDGPATALPHAEAIQRAFGHHDISGVRAHVGGAAADAAGAIGAHAYATGDHVAFAAAPDLQLAAHEAAHVVQQRGGVRLSGGVGAEGDEYERNADAVADRVVRGESAQALLDTSRDATRGGVNGPALPVQRGRESPLSISGSAVQCDRRLRYGAEPLRGTEGEATTETHRAELAAASLDELFAGYAAPASSDPAAHITVGGGELEVAWLHSRAGTVMLRGELRSRLLAETPAQVDAHRPVVAGLTGDPERIAELTALLDETAPAGGDRAVLLDQSSGDRTFYVRSGRARSRGGEAASDGAASDGAASGTGTGHSHVAGRVHSATDASAPTGTGIYAPAEGEVTFSGGSAGYGNLVRIFHAVTPPTSHGTGPFESVYAHLSDRLVGVGDHVNPGQAIGLVGRTSGDEHGDAGWVPPFPGPSNAHLHMAVIRLRAGSDGRSEGHSSPREERSGIEPDEWLGDLHVSIGAAPIFAMDTGEAAAADTDALDHGGVRPDPSRNRWVETRRAASSGAPELPGVGRAGDAFEQHADAVASAVVAGQSAEPLLDAFARRDARWGESAGAPLVQRWVTAVGEGSSTPEEPERDHLRGGGAEPSSDALPPGLTEEQIPGAIAHNDGLELRIDWVRLMQQQLRADHLRVSRAGEFDRETVVGIARYQARIGHEVTGKIVAHTRRQLELDYPVLHATLIGGHLDERVLVPAAASLAQRYDYYASIITGAGGVFLDGPREINLLAIRGVAVAGSPPALELRQTSSAGELARARAADGDPIPGASPPPAPEGDAAASPSREHLDGRRGYDDVIISIWYDGTSDARAYHVTERVGSVDPASIWSTSEDNPNPETEGSAHLRDGQYLYGLGTHSTGADGHVAAARRAFGGEHEGPVSLTDLPRDRVRYTALNAARDIEVWRDSPGGERGGPDDHYLTSEEERRSEDMIYASDARYTDAEAIDINIHSSPNGYPSSLGCQVVPIGGAHGYEEMIGEVAGSANSHAVYYTLIDASRVPGELVLEASAPRS